MRSFVPFQGGVDVGLACPLLPARPALCSARVLLAHCRVTDGPQTWRRRTPEMGPAYAASSRRQLSQPSMPG
jgi:hypothetical protein